MASGALAKMSMQARCAVAKSPLGERGGHKKKRSDLHRLERDNRRKCLMCKFKIYGDKNDNQ